MNSRIARFLIFLFCAGFFSAPFSASADYYIHKKDIDYPNTVQPNYQDSVIAIDPANSNIIYLGSWGGGISKSVDGGATWVYKNQGLPSKFIGSLVFDPQNSNTLYAGLVGHVWSNGGAVYKSTDGGNLWGPLPGAIEGGSPFNVNPCGLVQDMQIDPTNPDRFYFGMAINYCNVTGNACGGYYRTSDGGATFAPNPGCSALRPRVGSPPDYNSNDATIIRLNSLRPNELYVGPGWVHPEEEAIATSYDYGDTIHYDDVVDTRGSFLPPGEQYAANLMTDMIELSSQNPDVRYSVNGNYSGVKRRADGIAAPIPNSLFTTQVAAVLVRYSGLTSQSAVDGEGDNDLDGDATPDRIWKPIFFLNDLPSLGTSTVYRQSAILPAPDDANKVYLATYAMVNNRYGGSVNDRASIWEFTPGVSSSSPWGYRKLYEALPANPNNVSYPFIKTMRADPNNPYRIYFTQQENSTYFNSYAKLNILESSDEGATWSVRTVSSHFTFFHANDIREFTRSDGSRRIFLDSTQGIYYLKESVTPNVWTPLNSAFFVPQGSSFRGIVQSPFNKDTFFAKAPRYVIRSVNGGDGFFLIDEIRWGLGDGSPDPCPYTFTSPPLTTMVFNTLAPDSLDPLTIYAGSEGGIWKNDRVQPDGNYCDTMYSFSEITRAWAKVPTTGLPSSYLWSLVFDPNDSSGHTMWAGTKLGLAKSTDHGYTWTPVLPNIREVTRIVISSTTIMATSLEGLYRSGDDGASWQRVVTGTVNDVSERRLYRGNWLAATMSGILKSVDDGVTWSPTGTMFTGFVEAVLYTSALDGTERYYYTGPGDGLYRTDVLPEQPAAIIILPLHNATVSSTVLIVATTSPSLQIAGVQFLANGNAVGNEVTAPPYQTNWDTFIIPNGAYILSAVAREASGMLTTSATTSVTVSNDHTPPNGFMSAPPANAVVSSTVRVAAFISDASGLAWVQFKLDGSNLGPLITTFPASTTWDTTTASDGVHAIKVVAMDRVGNIGSSTSRTVTVDNTAPVVTVLGPTGTLEAGTTDSTLQIATNEIATCRYATAPNIPFVSMASQFGTTGGTLHLEPVSGLSDGETYIYYIRCKDAPGNADTKDYILAFSVGLPGATSGPAPASISGKIGSALLFNGTSNYIFLPLTGEPFNQKPFTLLFWASSTIPGTAIFASGDSEISPGKYLYLGIENNKPVMRFSDDAFVASAELPRGWVHIAFVWEGPGKKRKIYVNGTLAGENTPNPAKEPSISSGFATGDGAWLGQGYDGTARRYLYGAIDEVRLYGRALSSWEVEGYYRVEQ